MSIRLKLALFITFLFLSAIGNAVLTFQLEKFGEEKLAWVNHTHEVILEINEFLSHMKDSETGQRGYLLTGDSAYLKPYYTGSSGVKEHFEILKRLTSDNPVQQKRLVMIHELMQLKLDELAETIRLTQTSNGNAQKALEIVKEDRGKQYMDEIRELLREFTHTELLLLEQRKGDFKKHRATIITTIVLEIMFFVFLAFMTISFLNRNLFAPLKLLLNSTHKMEKGEKVELEDITTNDEMGYLLTSFFKMHEKVLSRTEKLHFKAHHDELTGLKNRAKMHQEIQEVIKDLKAFNAKFAVLFIDLNKFKELNDTLGHDAGDEMLKETANRLRSAVRSDDTVFRMGGDEFLVLIKNVGDDSIAHHIVNNILEAVKTPVMIQGKAIEISLSIGIAISPKDTEKSDEILKYADVAMYEAKRDKERSYRFFDKSMLKRASDF